MTKTRNDDRTKLKNRLGEENTLVWKLVSFIFRKRSGLSADPAV
jgi:hypothetical protein